MLESTFVLGLNHHGTSTQKRSRFRFIGDKPERLMQLKQDGVESINVVSTCNRFELYGKGNSHVAKYFVKQNSENYTDISRDIFVLRGELAVRHIFMVASGLDSQIVGDNEILGQFKTSIQKSKQNGHLDPYLERLFNKAVEAAKEIKSKTRISAGTISHAYAAVKYIKENIKQKNLRILVIGAGEFSQKLCRYVRDILPEAHLAISNRTEQKGRALAAELSAEHQDYEHLVPALPSYDIVIPCLGGNRGPIFTPQNVSSRDLPPLFIDMSMPLSIDPDLVKNKSSRARLITLDELSTVVNRTLEERKSDIPKAQRIIEKHLQEFLEWSKVYEKSPAIKEMKQMLRNLSDFCPHLSELSVAEKEKIVRNNIAQFVKYIKSETPTGRERQDVIQDFLQHEALEGLCIKCADIEGTGVVKECECHPS